MALPARQTPAIPIVRSEAACFAVAAMPWQMRPPRDSITVILKGSFDLVPGSRARMRAEAEILSGDLYAGDQSLRYASDFAIFKPRADVTLVGAARSREPATAMRASFRFGHRERFDRSIVVIGDRRWIQGTFGDRASAPAPFTEMPLVWGRAFGGPAVTANPIGTSLPNLEDASALVESPSSSSLPVCFAPIAPAWEQRVSRLGTYDVRWLETRWPYLPSDADYSHEQCAPRAQQLAHLTGDEPFEIEGMSAEHPHIAGTLPGVRPRCVAQRKRTHGGDVFEVSLKLDTAAFDMEAMRLDLIWRGVMEVNDDEASELEGVLVHCEDLAARPMRPEDLHAAFVVSVAAILPAPAPPAPEEPERDPIDTEIEAIEAELRAKLPAPIPIAPASDEDLRAALERGGMKSEEIAALFASREDEPAVAKGDRRARFDAKLAANEPFDGMDLSGLDLSGLDLSGRSFVRANLKRARLVHASFANCDLSGAALELVLAPGAIFTAATLVDADLHGADLRAAVLHGALLSRATLSSIKAQGADFQDAHGEHADFADADVKGARFDGADLAGADFSRAGLEGASLRGAKLVEARFYDARARGACFDEADLTEARADAIDLPEASLRRVRAERSIWEGANLIGTSFYGAQLDGASFTRVRGEGLVLAGAMLREASFRRAHLGRAVFLKADLMQASFERATLTDADLRGANLHGAELFEAKIDGIQTELAIVTGSKLAGAR